MSFCGVSCNFSFLISNFTDLAPFESIEGVNVRFVTRPTDIEGADLVILPGSKNTIADLKWMRQFGLEAALKKYSQTGVVIGICGGFQMLGKEISDPDKVEEGGSIRGIGLLNTTTVLKDKKHRSQVKGSLPELTGVYEAISQQGYTGYEIHMGETLNHQGKPVTFVQDGNVFGTYVHGIFDEGDLALKLIRTLADKKGVNLTGTMDYQAFKEQEYDKLAQVLRDNLDMEYIYGVMGIDAKH